MFALVYFWELKRKNRGNSKSAALEQLPGNCFHVLLLTTTCPISQRQGCIARACRGVFCWGGSERCCPIDSLLLTCWNKWNCSTITCQLHRVAHRTVLMQPNLDKLEVNTSSQVGSKNKPGQTEQTINVLWRRCSEDTWEYECSNQAVLVTPFSTVYCIYRKLGQGTDLWYFHDTVFPRTGSILRSIK